MSGINKYIKYVGNLFNAGRDVNRILTKIKTLNIRSDDFWSNVKL